MVLSGISAVPGKGSYSGTPTLSWDNVRVNHDASFYIPGHGNHNDANNPDSSLGYTDGDFYGPEGQEVAGVFERGNLVGAFGGESDPNP